MRQWPRASPRSAATSGAGIAQGANVVRVSVANVRVEYEVRLQDFAKWLEKPGGSPRAVSDRKRLREILGMNPRVRQLAWLSS